MLNFSRFVILTGFLCTWTTGSFGAEPASSKNTKDAIDESQYKCTPTKEYVTTLNYLRDSKALQLGEQQMQQVAGEVAKGCTGAAERFIKVMELLLKAQFDSTNSLKLAKEMALSDDNKVEAFVMVFKQSYLSEYLDLDLLTSIKIARSFSVDFEGDQKMAKTNFSSMVEFCSSTKNLDLPHLKCAELASRVTKCGQKFKEELGKPFRDSYNYMRSDGENDPNLATHDALKLSEQLVCASPDAPANFKDGYRFAVSKSGNKLSRSDAVLFAKDLAMKTVKK